MRISVEQQPEVTTITGVNEQGLAKILKVDTRVFEAIKTLQTPTANGDVQRLIAEALRIPAPGGRCGKAASFIERYTNGYNAFNGWCALLIATNEGRKRFFQFNEKLEVDENEKAAMLTKTGTQVTSRQPHDFDDENLDVPEGYEISEVDMNETIDSAYRLLGFNPTQLTEEAPDLTYDDAVQVLKEKGA